MQRVVVVGAGVIGLSAALHLLERFPGTPDITIVSEEFSPNITSDRAAAIIVPPRDANEGSAAASAGQVSVRNAAVTQRTRHWALATLHRFHSLYRSEENAQVEICLEQGYLLLESPSPDPWYKDEVFGFRHVALDSVEASLLHTPPGCVDVWAFATYVVETTSYLRWLMEKVRRGGAKLEQRKISSFDELASYDIIINCTGIGSCDLVGDKLMKPVRGQTVVVKAPWIKNWIMFDTQDTFVGIFPRARNVVLGGTAQASNWSVTPDPQTQEDILKKCQDFFPSLCSAEMVKTWAGLRPLRDPIRLDSCQGPGGSLLIHCYGHGGRGVILSWGCALDIGDAVQQRLACSLGQSTTRP